MRLPGLCSCFGLCLLGGLSVPVSSPVTGNHSTHLTAPNTGGTITGTTTSQFYLRHPLYQGEKHEVK